MPIMPDARGARSLIERPSLPVGELVTIGCLPSEAKLWLYRRRGYLIGKGVRIAPGSLVIGTDVEIGDGVSIAPGVLVRGQKIRIGRGASIGALTLISANEIDVGEDAVINDRVWVSSGARAPHSAFHLGARAMLMRHSYVNCVERVSIGENSGVGGDCLLFTHGYWNNWFQGYPRQVAPIAIGKDVWLPWRVFVMPGATIGDGAVIGACSVVSGQIPARSLAVGSPARVIQGKEYPGALAPEQVASRLDQFLDDFWRTLRELGVDLDGRKQTIRVIGHSERPPLPSGQDSSEVVVSLVTLDPDWRARAAVRHVSWFDLTSWERSDRQTPVGAELVTHFQSYGVRFRRC